MGGTGFADHRLPFGLRSALKIFTAFADAVAWALHVVGVKFLIHYLNDFLIFCSPFSEEGRLFRHTSLEVLADLNVPVAIPKLEGPSTSITFLGILVDTERLELRLPLEKFSLVSSWLSRRSGSRSKFEFLLGHLS